jgi:hypothetical protein
MHVKAENLQHFYLFYERLVYEVDDIFSFIGFKSAGQSEKVLSLSFYCCACAYFHCFWPAKLMTSSKLYGTPSAKILPKRNMSWVTMSIRNCTIARFTI